MILSFKGQVDRAPFTARRMETCSTCRCTRVHCVLLCVHCVHYSVLCGLTCVRMYVCSCFCDLPRAPGTTSVWPGTGRGDTVTCSHMQDRPPPLTAAVTQSLSRNTCTRIAAILVDTFMSYNNTNFCQRLCPRLYIVG